MLRGEWQTVVGCLLNMVLLKNTLRVLYTAGKPAENTRQIGFQVKEQENCKNREMQSRL